VLLRSIGEQASSSLIEVMTGMGIGAWMEKDSGALFFDCTEPDIGISRALKKLGFSFDEDNSEDPTHAPFDRLYELLQKGPVVLGPLEFAKLVYNPAHVGSTDSDHYILAYDLDETYVYVHDPWGFPCARIAYPDLEKAWRAEAIAYKRGYFRQWSNPQRIERPNDNELYDRAIATCQEVYTTEQSRIEQDGKLVGSEAIRTYANEVRSRAPSSWQVSFLAKFSLPLSAKRSLDYAEFFKSHNKELSKIKYEQATLFGIAGTQTVAEEWSKLADSLDQLADKEDRFKRLII
jgi:hypothetical protein